jgi:aminoglycoside phosphotransferase (APT) family kinase protein
MHGDYQPHNLLFATELPARLTAVLDWEQATIGDPLLDLGLLLAGWADPGEPPRFASYMSPRDGLPTRAELLARYQQRSGRDVSSIAFYEVLAIFKLACVLEGNYRLWVTGRSSQEVHRRTGDIVLGLARQAQAACRGAAG